MAPSKPFVLVVEDEVLIALDIERIIAGFGYDYRTAETASRGAALIEQGPVKAAILDHGLPDATAHDLAKMLAGRGIPFAYCTGSPDAVQRGPGVTVIAKPFSDAAVEAFLRTIV